MRITLVISSLDPGGAERVMSLLANYLVSKGHEVSLITLSLKDSQPFYYLDPRVNLVQLNLRGQRPSKIHKIKATIKLPFYLRNAIKKAYPDVVLSFLDMMNVATLISCAGLKLPIIVSERIDPNFQLLPKLYNWLRLQSYKFAKAIIVQTNNAASFFKNEYTKLISIIPNPVRKPNLLKEYYTDNITKIITFGRLDAQKDQKTLITAFKNILVHYPHLTLSIYGEGRERVNLEKQVKDLGLEGKVHLPGCIQNVEEALINADLFVFPSLYEGFPNALCEAMAVGLPVIASNCSGNTDVVKDKINGLLFPVGDVKALTQAMLQLIKEPKYAQDLANNAKKICDEFDATTIFTKWENCLKEAVVK